jgi:hypothetical protein
MELELAQKKSVTCKCDAFLIIALEVVLLFRYRPATFSSNQFFVKSYNRNRYDETSKD